MAFCTNCGNEIFSGKVCYGCGTLVGGSPVVLSSPSAPTFQPPQYQPQYQPRHPNPSGPMYFPVSPLKLIVMSVCTFGVYELYWFYKNWCLIKEREKLDIRPFWRAVFAYFFCLSCFKKIRTTAQTLNLKESIAAGPLAAGWIIVSLLWWLPDPYWLLFYFAMPFLIPVQILVTKVNATADPGCEENKRFTAWNIAAVVFGGMFLILILIVSFAPPEQ